MISSNSGLRSLAKNLQLTAQLLLSPMLGWWLSPTITLLREQLSTSTVMMALFLMNEGWLFVKAMVSGILNFQVSIGSD